MTITFSSHHHPTRFPQVISCRFLPTNQRCSVIEDHREICVVAIFSICAVLLHIKTHTPIHKMPPKDMNTIPITIVL